MALGVSAVLGTILLVLFWLVVAVLVVVFGILRLRKAWRRRRLPRIAAELGMTFESKPKELPSWRAVAGLASFDRADPRKFRHAVRGARRGTDLAFVRYHFATGPKRRLEAATLAIADLRRPMPRLCIRPEGRLDRFFNWSGADDVEFESEEFNRAFVVQTEDRRFAYGVLDDPLQRYLLELKGAGLSRWETSGTLLALVLPGDFDPLRCAEALDAVAGFVERMSPQKASAASA